MPVLISFLNATAGLAAALSGLVIENRLLVATGAAVAASGSVLTLAMCKAMNRGLGQVLWPAGSGAVDTISESEPPPEAATKPGGPVVGDWEHAVGSCREARSVIMTPGYGMALAQAQVEVAVLATLLEKQGKQVRFAIHPVAGRMPGHMHILLAEAEVSYTKLCDLEQINGDFPGTDLAIVIGASDVVNPAASSTAGTPISGMPILDAHRAGKVLVFNLDERPGYSGVNNLLYGQDNAILMWGDAKENLQLLIERLQAVAAEGAD